MASGDPDAFCYLMKARGIPEDEQVTILGSAAIILEELRKAQHHSTRQPREPDSKRFKRSLIQRHGGASILG